jgi:hypothetical protein
MDVKKNISLNDTPLPHARTVVCAGPSESVMTFSAGFRDSRFAEREIKNRGP